MDIGIEMADKKPLRFEDSTEWQKRNPITYPLDIYVTDTGKYSVKSPLAVGPGKIFPLLDDAIGYCKSIAREYRVLPDMIKEWE